MIVEGRVVRGHQVASGKNGNPLFPGGTLAMQVPAFQELGLDLSNYHLATLNVSIEPLDFSITNPQWHFANVDWHPTEPPEEFSFVAMELTSAVIQSPAKGLLYYPHPETKPTHHQPSGILEIILENFLPGLEYGSEVQLHIPSDRFEIIKN